MELEKSPQKLGISFVSAVAEAAFRLRRLAEPRPVGDRVKAAIVRAAYRSGLPNGGMNMAGIGHNGIVVDQLRSIIERIERLEEERAAIAEDIKEVYAEAKANGYDTKTLRAVVRIRKQDTAERQEQEALLDLYLSALGMTPIERAIAAADDSLA